MSDRMQAAAAAATEAAGIRFSKALVELKRRKGGAELTPKEQSQAAEWACLNRKERRRLRRAK